MLGDRVVLPGEPLFGEEGVLRGHGTQIPPAGAEAALLATLGGRISRVNKLVSVVAPRRRFLAEVGDLVVGRVVEVQASRWKVDVRGASDATLALSSVQLPGGQQRIRTHEDQLRMRELYEEGDLISAEVQAVKGDGTVHLHTRSLRYGKLVNGMILAVPPALVKRLKQHILHLPIDAQVILGVNGYIWITRDADGVGSEADLEDKTALAEELQEMRNRHAAKEVDAKTRRSLTRLRNAIRALARGFQSITPDSIMAVYEKSLEQGIAVHEMLGPDFPMQAAAFVEEFAGDRRRRRRS